MAGFGFPELTAGNPSLQRLLSGAAFPIGLILVVILGAELFTGNNAVLMPAALQGKISPWAAVRNWVAVYLGYFMGALLFTMLLYSSKMDFTFFSDSPTHLLLSWETSTRKMSLPVMRAI